MKRCKYKAPRKTMIYYCTKQRHGISNLLVTVCSFVTSESSAVFVCLELERNPTFYILSIVLPIVGILLLNTLVFILPIESGERISFSLTLMLATAVFLTVIADEIPKVSDPVPVICTLLFSAIVHGICNTILLILNMRIYYRKSNVKIGTFYRLLVKITQAKCILDSTKSRYENRQRNKRHKSCYCKYVENQNRNEINHDKETTSGDCINMDSCTSDLQTRNARNKDIKVENVEINYAWQDVGQAIDLILFVLSIAFIFIGSILSLYYLKVSSDNDDSYAEYCMTTD